MSAPLLATKLHIPPPRPKAVLRPRLVERLDEGLQGKLTLVSAPAGFGKTTLVSEWAAGSTRPVAWLSLDDEHNDPTRFLAHLVAALQTVDAKFGDGVQGWLKSPQPPPIEVILTALLNELAAHPDGFVLDDYHIIDGKAVGEALTSLLEHLPPQAHLLIATRVDPNLPLARMRARGQLTELRAVDLRFTTTEAARFLNEAMGLYLSAGDVAALEARTEGWIAGLQLAAISLQGHNDASRFIEAFTGNHRFVLDYLVEEVLQRQPQNVQAFLLCTSILDRLCGPLCDAVLHDPSTSGQATLDHLEKANLFVVPLDSERRWYRYHHLFADLLRQRLRQSTAEDLGGEGWSVADLHVRASLWFEDQGLELEAFQHAAAANDVERAERLIEGKGMPLYYRGAGTPVHNWLVSLPTTVLDARPSLRVTYASVLTFAGRQTDKVEEILQAAEAALQGDEPDETRRDLHGRIASLRAMLAIPMNQADAILAHSRRALELLQPDNLPFRTAAIWTQGFAHQLIGEHAAASRAYTEAIALGQASGNTIATIAATTCLGQVQEAQARLHAAAESYRHVLDLVGDPPFPAACEAHLGLARVLYQWNELEAAERHAQRSAQLAPQVESVDTPAACGVLLAHLSLARGEVAGAAEILAEADQFVRRHGFAHRIPDVAAAQVRTLTRQGNLVAAARLAEAHDLPISQARVHLAQGNAPAALAVLEPLRRKAEARRWQDERLKVTVLQALALRAHGDKERAVRLLEEALVLAEPGGFIRVFVDEGTPMARLLSVAAARAMSPGYVGKLLAAFVAEERMSDARTRPVPTKAALELLEPLSERELEVLRLVAQGLSNRQISERLYRALSTIKGHNRTIFAKLQVKRRTEAVARARELGLL